jgi:SAM-dependent methyltransferase
MTEPLDWDAIYAMSGAALWETGRPQPAFQRLADDGLLAGRVLDAGCGTGEHALLAAAAGADATGVDISPRAIEQARAKAAARGLTARFDVGDVQHLDRLGLAFDLVIDSGLYHILDSGVRATYVARLAAVLRPGGTCYLLCLSEREPGAEPPRRVTRDELHGAFGDGWTVTGIEPDVIEVRGRESGFNTGHAWLATIRRN